MRRTTILVTDETCAYYVQDAAFIAQIPLPAYGVEVDFVSSSPDRNLRAEKIAADPRKAAAMARARQRLAKSVPDQAEFNLARLRLEAGLSQAELARRMKTQQPAVARFERGEGDLNWNTMCKLANALGVDIHKVVDALVAMGGRVQA